MAGRLKSAKIAPCGKVAYVQFDDGAGGPTDVTAYVDGATLTVGGAARPLVLPFWPIVSPTGHEAGSWAQFPLGAPIFQNTIGKADSLCTKTGGGWTRQDVGYTALAQDHTVDRTNDGGATARYAFGMLPAGSYRISANLQYIGGASHTTDATYTILDSDGSTVLATYHVDQTSHTIGFNRDDAGLQLTDLGDPVTTTGTGLTVVVSNGAGVPFGTAFDDLFARPDTGASVGNGWVELHPGVWSISGNALIATGTGATNTLGGAYDLLRPASEDCTNQQIEFTTVGGVPTGSQPCMYGVLRYNRTTGDKFFVKVNDSQLILGRVVAGAEHDDTSTAITVPAGHDIRVKFKCQGVGTTFLDATVFDVTGGGTVLGTIAGFAENEATLQAAGGAGLTYDDGGAGVASKAFAEFKYTNNDGPAVVVVDDTFHRSGGGGAVGNGWVDTHGGSWAIVSHQLIGTGNGDASPIDHGYDLLRPSGEDSLNQLVSATVPITGSVVGNAWHAIPVARYNRTTGDKYFGLLLDGAIGVGSSIAGASSVIGGGAGMTAVTVGHSVRMDLTVTGSNPTTLTATATDTTTGTILGTVTRTDTTPSLQVAGGSGVGMNGATGIPTTYTEVSTTNLGSGGGSTLATDLLYAETYQPRSVPLGATVTLDAPSGTFTTGAGAVPAIVSYPVPLTTDLDWLPAFDPAAPHPLVLGFNRAYNGNCSLPNRFYFNVFRDAPGAWTPHNQAVIPVAQATGELNGIVTDGVGQSGGRAEIKFISNITNDDDGFGYINQPRSTRWRVEGDFTSNGEGSTPVGFGFTASTQDVTIANVTDPALVSGSTTRWFVEADITLKNVPDPANFPGFSPGYSLDVSVCTVSQMNNLTVVDVGNHAGWSRMVHPEFYTLLHGKGFGDLRQLDAVPINFSNAIDADHLAPLGGRLCSNVSKYIAFVDLVSIEAVDLTSADTNDALKWFGNETNRAVVLAKTAAPHGIQTGQRPDVNMDNFPGGLATTWPSNISGQAVTFNSNYGQWMSIVLDPTTLLMQMQLNGPAYPGAAPATLAAGAPISMTGTRLILHADPGDPIEDCITGAVEVGMVPWVNVPLMLSPAATTAMANRILAVLPVGQVIRLEHYNEPWNNLPPSEWMRAFGIHQVYLATHGLGGIPFVGDPIAAYAYMAHRTFELFRAAWVAAGRPETDVIRVLGTQAGYPEFPTCAMLAYTYNAGKMFDELAGEGYESPIPTFTRSFGGPDVFSSFQRLDVEGTISALGPVTTDTGRSVQVGRQIACLAGTAQNLARTAPMDSMPWSATPGYFANVKYIQYEAGRDQCNMRSPLNDARTRGDDAQAQQRVVALSHAVIRHPRMYPLEIARIQTNELAGVTRQCRFTLNLPQTTNPNNWNDYWTFNQANGTGASSENANPFDAYTALSQTGGAFTHFAGLSSVVAATAYTISTAGTGTVGVGQSVTVAPNGTFTGTITLAATHGTLAQTVFTFAGSAPQSTTFTPSSQGTGVISGTNSGTLTNPAGVNVTITASTVTATGFVLTISPTTETTGTAATVTVATVPSGATFSGSVGLSVTGTGGSLGATTLIFSFASSHTTTVQGSAVGTLSVSMTNTGGLTNSSPATLTVTSGGGTTITTDDINAIRDAIWGATVRTLTAFAFPVRLDLTQAVPTTNTANTTGDCLNAARAQGFGKWVKSGSTLNIYGPDGTTIIHTFTLNDPTGPTSRS